MNTASHAKCFPTLSMTIVGSAANAGTQCTEKREQVLGEVCTADQGLCSTNRFKLKSIPKCEAAVVPRGLGSVAYTQLLSPHAGLHTGLRRNPLIGPQPCD
jgi:hypothetical protein